LVAEALACTGRHDQKYISTGGRGFTDSLLVDAKIAETEGAVEQSVEVGVGLGGCHAVIAIFAWHSLLSRSEA
jgi:hypothetical protein